MDGFSRNGVSLYLTKFPDRKGHCFCFVTDTYLFPVAYVSEKHIAKATELWLKLIDGMPSKPVAAQKEG